MNIIVETDNLIIRDVEFDDYEFFLESERNPEVIRFFSINEGRTYEQVVTEAFAFRYDDNVMDLTIAHKGSGEPLGRIIISRIDNHYKSLDLTKIYVGGNYRGKGIGREAIKGILKYCFCDLGMERVTLDYYTGNERAAKLYRELGFKDEGRARHATLKDGVFYDLNIMSILSDEYFG